MIKNDEINQATSLLTPLTLGGVTFANRLIQGPLAGVSAAPFRRLFYQYVPPAYTVTEMISAQDVLTKHQETSRYLYRAVEESSLCYQLAGVDPGILAKAARRLQQLGADVIDINCGCPKAKIRKKGAGSALMDDKERLRAIVSQVRDAIDIPLTIKLRIYGNERDLMLAQSLQAAGADALIIHGRQWTDDYDTPCDLQHIRLIKQGIQIPLITNGDICDGASLTNAVKVVGSDAYMISRAGCGQAWLFQQLLDNTAAVPPIAEQLDNFIQHIDGLCHLEGTYQAMMQSKTLVRYYFRQRLSPQQLQTFYALTDIATMKTYLERILYAQGDM